MNTLLFAMLLTFTSSVYAGGGGHFHPKKVAKCGSTCTADQIKAAVPEGVKELVKWGKMDAKWEKALVEGVEKKTFKKAKKSLTAWVVTLSESSKAEKKDKTYVFFTEDGMVFRTNGTGVLK